MTTHATAGDRLAISLHDLILHPRKSNAEKSHAGEQAITCSRGHKHWGAHGAAGILVRAPRPDGTTAYLLQRRGEKAYDNAGKWGTFGGGLLPEETPEEGAHREFHEEVGTARYQLGPSVEDDHGKWKYTTFTATAPETFWPAFNGSTPDENMSWGWFTPEEMKKLDLHPAFKKTLPRLLAAEDAKHSPAERAEKRFDPAEPRDSHGRWAHLSGAVGDAVYRNAKYFDNEGGVVERDADQSPEHITALREEVRELERSAASNGHPEFAHDMGVQFTHHALTSNGDLMIVARDDYGDIAGALSARIRKRLTGPALYIDYVGTTGSIGGAGTRLAVEAARFAAERGMPVIGEIAPGAEGFWQKIGWHRDPMGENIGDMHGWTAQEAQEIAGNAGS